ncbi:nucleotide-diphospho-sugar transferase [Gigaspora margarita]|uniref:Translation initiation factor eIF2B subunit gamma n=1 Tax=Gigaspora margarita TaxID=4874 RepID=A0A8H3ZZN0_GIGMA|nr:nucleotide-diphospho-sugar transferase [Gigaspora margarita]
MLPFDANKKQSKQKHGRYSEFQAIVLAGYGHRLYPLSEDNNLPKALLPLANKPMLYYVLDWLERAGIFDVLVITEANGEYKIGHYLKNDYEGKLKPNLEVVREDVGTADVLRIFSEKIKSDFIVMSCDLVFDLVPHRLLDYHRTHDPTFTALYFEPNKSEGGGGSSSSYKDDKDPKQFVGVDTNKSRIVYVASSADLDEEFSLRMSLLWKFPCIDIHTNLQDAHLYIFKRWVIDLIVQRKAISSVREHLVPLLIKCQYQKKLLDSEGINKLAATYENYQKTAIQYSASWNDDDKNSPVRCQIFIYKTGFCGRGNTIYKYCDLNRHTTKIHIDPRVSPSAEINSKAQVGSDSLVGDDTKIDERTSIKRSTIGTHCAIGKNVKISNSILMDNIVIEDNVKLDGCVVCNGAKIMEKSQLKDCEVGGGYVVVSETQAKNEQLVEFRDLD